jgi:ComF family protein
VAIGWLAPAVCVGCGNEGAVLCVACCASEILPYGSRCWRCGTLTLNARTCKRCRPGSPKHIWIATDYSGVAKETIHTYKFGHLRVAAITLAELMHESFLTYNSDEGILAANYLVVPIPTATSRIRERSFGPAELIARNFARIARLEYANALGRLGQAKQRGARREQRLKQVEGQYYVKKTKKIAGRRILLIDDVLTTGGTLKSAYKTLRNSGSGPVDGVVFAKKL